MANGYKTGGRQKGTPNKKTREFQEILGDYNPLEALLKIIQNEETPLEIRNKINLDLLAYMYPKRKAIEVSSADIASPIINIVASKELNI